MVQRTALYLGVANLVLGSAGFVGPLVEGGGQRAVNIEAGLLFGVLAVNWAHALVHIAFGAYGVHARRTADAAATYLWAVAVVFGLLGVGGLLEQAGLLVRRTPDGMLLVVELAVNAAGNAVHLVLAGLAVALALRQEPETAEASRAAA